MKLRTILRFGFFAVALSVVLSGCTTTPCTLVARQPIGQGEWVFRAVYPDPVITAPSGGNVGAAEVKCIYSRPVIYWFNCCNDRFFPVHGVEWGAEQSGPGSTLPVVTASVPLPVQGALGQAASLLGVSLDLGSWFQNQAAAEVLCPGSPGHVADDVTIPECKNGSIILPWHTWPSGVALEELPEDAQPVQ